MDALKARFGDHTDALFRRHNMKSIGYWQPQDAPEDQWPMPIRIAMAILAIGVVGFTTISLFGLPAHDTGAFAKYLYAALNLLAAGLIALRAYRVPADRLAWFLIAAGMACSALGDVVYALRVPDGQSPSAAGYSLLGQIPRDVQDAVGRVLPHPADVSPLRSNEEDQHDHAEE